MKILQLCKKFPYPLKDGESIAVSSLAGSLAKQGCEITLLAMNTSKHFFKSEKWPQALHYYRNIYTVQVDNRIKIKDAFFNLFSSESYHVARFISPAFQRKLISLLQSESFDVIQLETLYLAPYIPVIRKYSQAIVSMRAHNIEHEIWRRITENTRFGPKKWYLKHLTGKLKRYEIEQLKNYDVLLPITPRDLEIFQALGYKNKAVVIPIGINFEDYKPSFDSFHKDLTISFIGSLDWMPNQEGLMWFLEKVWGRLSKKFPKLKLHVAGRNMPDWIKSKRIKNVVFHGEVPDATDFINQHSIMVVPLLSGSGMRAKILEGMALGKVVISTSLGLEGIEAKDKKQVLIANDEKEFVRVFDFCYELNGELEQMGKDAQRFVNWHYDSSEIAGRLAETYASLLAEVI
jgi:glycosyltransferase involved in cell wall biosynthesis